MTRTSLAGRCAIVPESRELDLFSSMIARHGAQVIRCPLVSVSRLSDHSQVDAWLERLLAGTIKLIAFYTGEGVLRLVDRADELGRRNDVVEALARTYKIARGPKPGSALRKFDLKVEAVTPQPTTDGLLDLLATMDLTGRTVGVQLYPDAPVERLQQAIEGGGGDWDPVLPYDYAAENADDEVASAIERMANNEVDLIAFTSQLQVHRLSEVAAKRGMVAQLDRAFAATTIAAIGPITADAVERAGGIVAIQPRSNFHMKPLVAEIVRQLGKIRPGDFSA